MSAQRAGDGSARFQVRLAGSVGSGKSREAALTEAVFTLKLPGTPPTCVIGPVTNPALKLRIHASARCGLSGRRWLFGV